jgi:hypothetical protein
MLRGTLPVGIWTAYALPERPNSPNSFLYLMAFALMLMYSISKNPTLPTCDAKESTPILWIGNKLDIPHFRTPRCDAHVPVSKEHRHEIEVTFWKFTLVGYRGGGCQEHGTELLTLRCLAAPEGWQL